MYSCLEKGFCNAGITPFVSVAPCQNHVLYKFRVFKETLCSHNLAPRAGLSPSAPVHHPSTSGAAQAKLCFSLSAHHFAGDNQATKCLPGEEA